MERYADELHSVRYEELVTEPMPVIHDLSDWLGVEPSGFNCEMVHAKSVGKHAARLD